MDLVEPAGTCHYRPVALPMRYPMGSTDMPKAAAGDAESRRLRFTQLAVDRLAPPAQGRVEFWDTVLPGFGLRVAANGRKTWQVLYRVAGRPVRETLGTVAVIPRVDDARSAARASLARAGQGGDPVAERKAAKRNTVAALFAE